MALAPMQNGVRINQPGVAAPTPIPAGWHNGVRVNQPQLAAMGHPATAAHTPIPAPSVEQLPPPSKYDPARDINIAEGKRSYEQGRHGLERQKTQAESEYGINSENIGDRLSNGLADIGTQRGQQKYMAEQQLNRLSESFKKLASRQGEQGNTTGTLYGGAMLAAANARAHNEGIGKEGIHHGLEQAENADNTRESRLKEGVEDSEGSNVLNRQRLLGGESNGVPFQGSITEGISNAKTNELGYTQGEESLRSSEAIKNGWNPAQAPKPPRPTAKGNGWVHTKGGSYRIGGRR